MGGMTLGAALSFLFAIYVWASTHEIVADTTTLTLGDGQVIERNCAEENCMVWRNDTGATTTIEGFVLTGHFQQKK